MKDHLDEEPRRVSRVGARGPYGGGKKVPARITPRNTYVYARCASPRDTAATAT
jgi:hypothetical protein